MGSEEACRSARAGLERAKGRSKAAFTKLSKEERELEALHASGAAPAVIEAKKNSVERARSARDAAVDNVSSMEQKVSDTC
jgi:hypothetical protein